VGIRVRIFHPGDPLGTGSGGIETFIRGIVRWAPDDIDISVVGVSTDNASRPAERWTVCDVGRRTFRFFPVLAQQPGLRPALPHALPLALRYSSMPLSSRRSAMATPERAPATTGSREEAHGAGI